MNGLTHWNQALMDGYTVFTDEALSTEQNFKAKKLASFELFARSCLSCCVIVILLSNSCCAG